MAWLARSLSNPFNSDDHPAGEDHPLADSDSPRSKGVKEDLSEITKSFTRQLWGVASFLAPPPQSTTNIDSLPPHDSSSSNSPSPAKDSGDDAVSGMRTDLSEIGGRFMASGNKAVSEISRLASSFLPFGPITEEGSEETGDEPAAFGAVGVTEEVLTFARNISMHPETWLDFPLFTDDEDSDDFEMSDAQQDHALAVESLAPRLAALRIELCPGYMSEGCFWKIYFVLLHSRLNKHDAELLSTPQIVQARSMLQELQNRKKADSGRAEISTYAHEPSAKWPSNEQNPMSEIESSFRNVSLEQIKSVEVDIESEKLSTANDSRYVDKSVIGEEPFIQNKDVLTRTVQVSSQTFDEDDNDEWIEESAEISGVANVATALLNDEDVSFSDLEEDDDNFVQTSSKAKGASVSSIYVSKV